MKISIPKDIRDLPRVPQNYQKKKKNYNNLNGPFITTFVENDNLVIAVACSNSRQRSSAFTF